MIREAVKSALNEVDGRILRYPGGMNKPKFSMQNQFTPSDNQSNGHTELVGESQ